MLLDAEDWVMFYVLVTLAILVGVAAVAIVVYVIYYYVFRGLLAPVRKVKARVLSKQQRDYQVDLPRGYTEPGWQSMLYVRVMNALGRDTTVTVYEYWDYFVVFSFDGKEQEFAVPEETYADVSEGDEGVLAYKGSLFRYYLPLRQGKDQKPVPPAMPGR